MVLLEQDRVVRLQAFGVAETPPTRVRTAGMRARKKNMMDAEDGKW